MKIYFAGDKSQAICEHCGLVSTTFDYRDVTLEISKKVVKNILVAVCDQCGAIVSTPAQSTPAIKAELEKADESINVQLPSPYLEILDLACQKIDPKATQELRKRLLLFYVHKHATKEFDLDKSNQAYQILIKLIPTARKFPKKRLTMRISKRMADEFDMVVFHAKKSKAEVLKLIVAEIKLDVIDGNKKLNELRAISVCA